jgi:hypothetical protein
MVMKMTPEEEFLETLWADDAGESECKPMMLAESTVIFPWPCMLMPETRRTMHAQVIMGASARQSSRDSNNSYKLVSLQKDARSVLQKRGGGLSPLISSATGLQQQLDAVIERIETKKGLYDQCMLELRKAGEVVKSTESEIRYVRGCMRLMRAGMP